jgi:hypothetical protein
MKFKEVINKLDNFADKVYNFSYTEKCNGCNNNHTSMCDLCCNVKFPRKNYENHHTDNYLDINFEPKFLEFDFEDNMKINRRLK